MYWEAIRLPKQKIIDKKIQIENKNRKLHTYIIQDKLLVRNKKFNSYEETYVGPYIINQVWASANVTICWGAIQERINIIWIKPYHEQ